MTAGENDSRRRRGFKLGYRVVVSKKSFDASPRSCEIKRIAVFVALRIRFIMSSTWA